MNKSRLSLPAAAICALLIFSSQARGQATRTWVSGGGNDANPCSRSAPCQSFNGAMVKTAAGGEISVLDPGGFGTVTVNKSLTINGDGSLAGITFAGTNGIIVNAGANDVVTIRNLSFNGVGTGLSGIRFVAGGQLHIENCSMTGFGASGIGIEVAAAASSILTVKNTTIAGATNSGATGIKIGATAGSITASLERIRVQGLNTGLDVLNGGVVTLTGSVIAHNATNGILAETGAVINVGESFIVSNGVAVQSNAGGVIRLTNNSIFNNVTGISASGSGIVVSFGNNKMAGNTTQGAPTAYLSSQ